MPELIVGVIGYQNHSYKIISNLAKNKSIKKIYSFCYKKEKIRHLNRNNKIKILEYVSDMEKLDQCKSVFISSATKTHFEYIKKFIKKKIYIYCEKPGPTNLKQINFLKKLPKKIKEKIYFGHNLLHSDVYSFLREIIENPSNKDKIKIKSKRKLVRRRFLYSIAAAWVITVPASAIMAGSIYYLFSISVF